MCNQNNKDFELSNFSPLLSDFLSWLGAVVCLSGIIFLGNDCLFYLKRGYWDVYSVLDMLRWFNDGDEVFASWIGLRSILHKAPLWLMLGFSCVLIFLASAGVDQDDSESDQNGTNGEN